MDRYVHCTANTTLTAAHVKSAVQSQVLCADCSYSQHMLQFHGGGTVSGFTHCIFLRCCSLGNGRLYGRVAVRFDSHKYSARSVFPLSSNIHPQTQTQTHNWTCAPPAPPMISSYTAIQPKYIHGTQIQVCTHR